MQNYLRTIFMGDKILIHDVGGFRFPPPVKLTFHHHHHHRFNMTLVLAEALSPNKKIIHDDIPDKMIKIINQGVLNAKLLPMILYE